MLVANPSGRDRFAPDFETIYEYFKHSHSSQDGVSQMKKTCKLSTKDACSTYMIGTAHATFTANGHACCAPEPPATGSSFETLCVHVIALDVLLQTAYALLNDQRAYSFTPASFPSQFPVWLDGYLKTHYVHGLNYLNLNKVKTVARQDHTSPSYLTSSSQLGHANAQDNPPLGIRITNTELACKLHVRSDTGNPCVVLNMLGISPLQKLLFRYCRTTLILSWRKRHQTYSRWNECPEGLYYSNHGSNNLNKDRKSKNGDKSISNESHDFKRVPSAWSEGLISKEKNTIWKQQGSEGVLHLEDEQDLIQVFNLDTAGLQEYKTSGLVKDIWMDRNYSIQLVMLKESNGDDVDFMSIQQANGSERNESEQKGDTHQQQGHLDGYSVSQGKRSISSTEFQDNDDVNDSERDGGGSKAPGKKRVKYNASMRFACPFYKHDPDRYKAARSCCGPGWESVHRVKEHIFRSHSAPDFVCQRCFDGFKSPSSLTAHLRDEVPCKIRQRPKLASASQEALRLLRSRSKRTTKSLTEEEKWCNMYKIIFPNDTPIPSPYYGHRVSESTDLLDRNAITTFKIEFHGRLLEELSSSKLVELSSPNMIERMTRLAVDAFISTLSTSERSDRSPNDARQTIINNLSDTDRHQSEAKSLCSPAENGQTALPDGTANLGKRQDAGAENISSPTDLTACGTWSHNRTEKVEQVQPSAHTDSWQSNSSGYPSSTLFDFRVPVLPRNDWTEPNNLEPGVVYSADSTYGSVPSESLDRHSLDYLKEWTMEGPISFFHN